MKFILITSFALLYNSFLNLYSQNDPDITNAKSDSIVKETILPELEVQANYNKIVTRRFPGSVYIVPNTIENSIVPINIAESLNKSPSVYAHTGSYNTSRITMRGIGTRSLYGTRKINALLNDIPLTSGEGDTFIDDIDLQLVSRTEVISGPTAGIYGPSLGGTLLLSISPAKQEKNYVYLNSYLASYGTLQNMASSFIRSGKSSVLVSVKNTSSEGYRENSSYDRKSFLVNYSFEGKKSQLNFIGLYTRVMSEIPSSIDSITFYNNPTTAAANWLKTHGRENSQRFLLGLTNRYAFSPSISGNVTLYHIFKKTEEVRPFNFLYENDIIGGIKYNLKMNFPRFQGLSITPGFSVFFERYKPVLFENIGNVGVKGLQTAKNRDDIFQANVFFILDYVPDFKNYISLSLNAGKSISSDFNSFANNPVKQTYNGKLFISPRISVSRQIVKNHFLFGSISRGVSYPSFQEVLYPNGTINNNVLPEQALSFEFGIKGNQLFKKLKYSISSFYMPVTNLIIPERIAEDTYIGKNAGKTMHKGVEFVLEKSNISIVNKSSFYIDDYKIMASFLSVKFSEFTQDSVPFDNNFLPGIPSKRIYLSSRFGYQNLFFIEPEVFINDRIPMNDLNTKFYPGYWYSNIKAEFQYRLFQKLGIKISGVINNVFDNSYASMILINAPSVNNNPPRYYYPGLPRNYALSVSIRYQL